MADGPVLLDTDAYSFLQAGREDWKELVRGRELVLSFVTIGEVLHGRHKLNWAAANIGAEVARLHAFRTISGTREVAQQFGLVKRLFHDQMPPNDLWQASCALAAELPLVTGDRHFEPVATALGLRLLSPRPTEGP